MKQIKDPGQWKLAIALIPIPLVYVYMIITRTTPQWTFFVGIASAVLYMSLLTYYCIKQKCYGQLISNCIVLIGWIIAFYMQFFHLDKMFSHPIKPE